jgi:amidase
MPVPAEPSGSAEWRFVGPWRLAFDAPVRSDADPPPVGDGGNGRDGAGGGAGPLSDVTLAVKDVIDVQGVATGAGLPDFLADARPAPAHAAPVQKLLDAGAAALGKAHTDELAFSLSGTNFHYGTPHNPAAPGCVPGGSSSGSASAVASGVAAIALGTDTAGSTRVPSSYCGIYGLRPTHGRIAMTGVLPLAPSFDTCGVFAAEGELLERAATCLLESTPAAPPEALVLGTDLLAEADPDVAAAVQAAAQRFAAALAVPLHSAEFAAGRAQAWLEAFRGRQFVEVWRAHGPWVESRHPSLGPGIAARFAAARATPDAAAVPATAAGDEVRERLDRVLPAGGALVLPATATVAPVPTLAAKAKDDLRARTMRLTSIAGLAGAPAVSLPLAHVNGQPVGLCLVGRPGDDERLLAAARA